MTILDEIRAHKEQEVAAREAARPLNALIAACGTAPPVRPLAAALRAAATPKGIAVIAEVKRRSPAAGELQPNLDAGALAASYVEAGAAGVSVLTDQRFFSGADEDLVAVRSRVAAPILRKDFTLRSYQIYEARALGADAILLIGALLTDEQLLTCLDTADCLGMDAIVEVHSDEEARRAVALHASIIGVNNRDLLTFTVDLATTERLRPLIPSQTLVISESGITSRSDVQRMQAAGANAVLVGEALLRTPDPGAKLRELLGFPASALSSELSTSPQPSAFSRQRSRGPQRSKLVQEGASQHAPGAARAPGALGAKPPKTSLPPPLVGEGAGGGVTSP